MISKLRPGFLVTESENYPAVRVGDHAKITMEQRRLGLADALADSLVARRRERRPTHLVTRAERTRSSQPYTLRLFS